MSGSAEAEVGGGGGAAEREEELVRSYIIPMYSTLPQNIFFCSNLQLVESEGLDDLLEMKCVGNASNCVSDALASNATTAPPVVIPMVRKPPQKKSLDSISVLSISSQDVTKISVLSAIIVLTILGNGLVIMV